MRDVQQARRYLDSFFVSSRAPKLTVTPVAQPQFRGAWFVPEDADSSITTLYFHGGGYSFYPRSYAHLISSVAQAAKSRTFALDYRLSPEFRFPAQLEDALHAYRWLLATGTKPSNLVVAGDSAGANLALALLQALRDANLPQPALAIALSPPTDFEIARTTTPAEESADWITWPMVSQWANWFCDSSQSINPLVSPALADLRGLAPIYIQAGRAEILYPSIQAFADRARRQGAHITLETWDYMNHDFQMFAPDVPQSVAALRRLGEVVHSHTRVQEASEAVSAAKS